MNGEDILRHWLERYQYRHTRNVYDSHYCCERLPYGKFHCLSPYCPDHCHRWEHKHYSLMIKGDTMNMHRLILPLGDVIPPPLLASVWENFARRLRRLYPGCEWYWVLELQQDNLHYHVLLVSDTPPTYHDVDEKWRKTLGKKGLHIPENTVRVKPVTDPETVASYNVKSRRGRPWEYRPPTGLYRNLAFASRGFFKTHIEEVVS